MLWVRCDEVGRRVKRIPCHGDDALEGVPQGSELTFAFEMAGVEFNPARVSFNWVEDEHTVQVRLRAASALDGKTARGRMTVFIGAIILADVPFSLRADSARAADRPKLEPEREAVRRYRRIFASYSHRDLPIVEQFECFVEATGDRYLRDHKILRAGEAWDDQLLELIFEVDIFHLFWSRNALASPHVRREWEHALSLGRDNFIHPVYWESPLPQAAVLLPEPLTRIHFQFLGAIAAGAEEENGAAVAETVTEDTDEGDDLSVFDPDDYSMELGCADCNESEQELESDSIEFSIACCPLPARLPSRMSLDNAVNVSAAANHDYRGNAFGAWRGILIGFCIIAVFLVLIASFFRLNEQRRAG